MENEENELRFTNPRRFGKESFNGCLRTLEKKELVCFDEKFPSLFCFGIKI